MYCIYCGKEIKDGAAFCMHCGRGCSPDEGHVEGAPPNTQGAVNDQKAETQGTIPCPSCGATNCQVISKSTTQVNSGGFGCCSGACGAILFGPLGALLGLCGRSTKVTTSSQTKWVCSKCGWEFMSPHDAWKAIDSLVGVATMFTTLTSLVLASIIIVGFGWGGFALVGTLATIAATSWCAISKNSEAITGYPLYMIIGEREFKEWEEKLIVSNLRNGLIICAVGVLLRVILFNL